MYWTAGQAHVRWWVSLGGAAYYPGEGARGHDGGDGVGDVVGREGESEAERRDAMSGEDATRDSQGVEAEGRGYTRSGAGEGMRVETVLMKEGRDSATVGEYGEWNNTSTLVLVVEEAEGAGGGVAGEDGGVSSWEMVVWGLEEGSKNERLEFDEARERDA